MHFSIPLLFLKKSFLFPLFFSPLSFPKKKAFFAKVGAYQAVSTRKVAG
jgi:hypothetical protein